MNRFACLGLLVKQGKVHRIHIIGGAGSGKTTLARLLAARLDISVYHLDEIYLRDASDADSFLNLLVADIKRIAVQSAWLTEGSYLWGTDELLRAADMIIWLDIPWHLALWRIIVRQVSKGLTNPSPSPLLQKLIGLIRFLHSERKYYLDSSVMNLSALHDANAKNRATTVQYLASYTHKLVHWRTPSEIETFLNSMR
jgi:adenylate kinase family enzyme